MKRAEVMTIYNTLKRPEKSELISKLGYKGSSAFKSYFSNKSLSQTEVDTVTSNIVMGYCKDTSLLKTENLADRLNALIGEVGEMTNTEDLKLCEKTLQTLLQVVQIKLELGGK